MSAPLSLYKAEWYWDEDSLIFRSHNQLKHKSTRTITQDGTSENVADIHFLENVDQNQQKYFKTVHHRTPQTLASNVVTMQDIKDVVTFLMVGQVPIRVLKIFLSYDYNKFLRALTVYLQLYLEVLEDLQFRKNAFITQHLKHPISIVRETLCQKYLSHLRSRVGQEYALIITGEGNYKQYHHMNNTVSRSYTAKDNILYANLVKLTVRVVWIALNRSNFKEIELEIHRIFFGSKNVRSIKHKEDKCSSIAIESNLDEDIKLVLYGDKVHFSTNWRKPSPVLSDIFENKDKPDWLLPKTFRDFELKTFRISGLEAALTMPEELLPLLKLPVGILGLSRDKFEVTLHPKQEPLKGSGEEELDKAIAKIIACNIVKPEYAIGKLLNILESEIDLDCFPQDEEYGSIAGQIKFYTECRLEDSKKSYHMWKYSKAFS